MKIKIVIILFFCFFISFSFVESQNIDQSGCNQEGVFVTVSGFESQWGAQCLVLCQNQNCECHNNGIKATNEINTAVVAGHPLANIVEHIVNPFVLPCKNRRITIIETIEVENNGVITQGVMSINNNLEIGRMIDKNLLPQEVIVNNARINFTEGIIYLYATYWARVEEVCNLYQYDWLKLSTQEALSIDFKNEWKYVPVGNLRDIIIYLRQRVGQPVGIDPKIVAFSSCKSFNSNYQECSGGKSFLITPKKCPQDFVVILEGDSKRHLCSSDDFIADVAGGGTVGKEKCVELVDGSIAYSQKIEKNGEEEYVWISEIEEVDDKLYYNIEALTMNSNIAMDKIVVTNEEVISESSNFKLKKTAEKYDIAPWTA